MHTTIVPFDVAPSGLDAAIRGLRRRLLANTLHLGLGTTGSIFRAVDDPARLLLTLPGVDDGDDLSWLTDDVPDGLVAGVGISCEIRHWYWNASRCSRSAAFTLIEAPGPDPAALIHSIDLLARTGLATRRGFVDFQLLQGVRDPGRIGVLHEWESEELLGAARRETAEALDRIAVEAHSRAVRYVGAA